jgi:xanthine dehydrogenase accessory factor
MYSIAEQVRDWLGEQRPVHVAQVVATRGVSSRDPAAAQAWTEDGESTGAVLPGVQADGPGHADGGTLVETTISDADATAAGLSCGGVLSVLIQPASAYPAKTWQRLTDREPLCLVTELDGTHAGQPRLFTPATIRDVGGVHGPQIGRLFGGGTSATALFTEGDTSTAVVVLWPVPSLVVVGDGLIADALVSAGNLLGWTTQVEPGVEAAVPAARALTRSDAVVVLSHDRDVDGPVLAAALDSDVGYIGALGSRRTQSARAQWLDAHDVDAAGRDRIHGPAGLDLDAHTPAEIAVSIVAEILAERSSAGGGSLRNRPGPVHVAGVSAPPPRYG